MKIKSKLSFLLMTAFLFNLCSHSAIFGCEVCGGKKDKDASPIPIPQSKRE